MKAFIPIPGAKPTGHGVDGSPAAGHVGLVQRARPSGRRAREGRTRRGRALACPADGATHRDGAEAQASGQVAVGGRRLTSQLPHRHERDEIQQAGQGGALRLPRGRRV